MCFALQIRDRAFMYLSKQKPCLPNHHLHTCGGRCSLLFLTQFCLQSYLVHLLTSSKRFACLRSSFPTRGSQSDSLQIWARSASVPAVSRRLRDAWQFPCQVMSLFGSFERGRVNCSGKHNKRRRKACCSAETQPERGKPSHYVEMIFAPGSLQTDWQTFQWGEIRRGPISQMAFFACWSIAQGPSSYLNPKTTWPNTRKWEEAPQRGFSGSISRLPPHCTKCSRRNQFWTNPSASSTGWRQEKKVPKKPLLTRVWGFSEHIDLGAPCPLGFNILYGFLASKHIKRGGFR